MDNWLFLAWNYVRKLDFGQHSNKLDHCASSYANGAEYPNDSKRSTTDGVRSLMDCIIIYNFDRSPAQAFAQLVANYRPPKEQTRKRWTAAYLWWEQTFRDKQYLSMLTPLGLNSDRPQSEVCGFGSMVFWVSLFVQTSSRMFGVANSITKLQ